MVSRPTRRAVLATCGATLLGGCSAIPGSEPPPDIDCRPSEHLWPMYGYAPSRTSRIPSRSLPPDDADERRFSRTGTNRSGGSVEAPPVIDDGVAYTAGSVRIEARSLESGERLWAIDSDDSIRTSPVLACDTLFVSGNDDTLALDPADGSVLWRTDAGTPGYTSSTSPIIFDDTVYLGGSTVTALDAETGKRRWRAGVGKGHVGNGIAVADRVYVGASGDDRGAVAAFSRDGDEWWKETIAGPVYTAPAVAGETVFVATKTGLLAALATSDGTVRWQETIPGGVFSPPAVADGIVVVTAGNGAHARAFEAATGDLLWEFQTGVSRGGPTIVGDSVLLPGANTGIYRLELATGEQLTHWPVENVGSQVVVGDGQLFYRAWNVSDVVVVG